MCFPVRFETLKHAFQPKYCSQVLLCTVTSSHPTGEKSQARHSCTEQKLCSPSLPLFQRKTRERKDASIYCEEPGKIPAAISTPQDLSTVLASLGGGGGGGLGTDHNAGMPNPL